jgi:hypothetical protein
MNSKSKLVVSKSVTEEPSFWTSVEKGVILQRYTNFYPKILCKLTISEVKNGFIFTLINWTMTHSLTHFPHRLVALWSHYSTLNLSLLDHISNNFVFLFFFGQIISQTTLIALGASYK